MAKLIPNPVVGEPIVLVCENGTVFDRIKWIGNRNDENQVISVFSTGKDTDDWDFGKVLSARRPTDYERGTYY